MLFQYSFGYKTLYFGYIAKGKNTMKKWEPYKINNKLEITEFYSAFVRQCTAEYAFPGESHDFWEFVYIIEGNVSILADDRVINLKRNQIVFHKPMEFHTLKPADNTLPKLFVMSFSVSGKLMNKFRDKIFYLQPDQRSMLFSIIEYMRKNNEIESENTNPISYLQRLSDNTCYGQTIKNMAENFLISLLYANESATQIVENNETIIYNKAISFIEENIFDKIPVSRLSRECNVSTAYLKKIFTKYTSLGIHEYIIKSKIALAKQMLDSGNSVTDISHRLSFSSQNYFSVVFKRETGFSPTQYKKRL